MKIVDKAIENVKELGYDLPQETINKYVEYAIKYTNPELAYELSCLVDVVDVKTRKKLEVVVLKSMNSQFAYKYALDIPGASVKHHEMVILKNKDLLYACDFACDVYGADIDKLQQLIIDANDPKFAYLFANYVEKANYKVLGQIVGNSKDENLIRKFMEIDGVNKKDMFGYLGRAVKSSKSKTSEGGISR